jgi:hypothetical protein
MADDALKSVPQFSGGHKEFIDWQQAAQTFIDAGYFLAVAAFQLLKKTLDGRPKKLVEKMSLQEPDLLEKMMKKLKKEYADQGAAGCAAETEDNQAPARPFWRRQPPRLLRPCRTNVLQPNA